MNKKIAFIFPGQGSQYLGMGQDLLEKYPQGTKLFEQANDILGFDLKKLCLEGPKGELDNTENTQVAIFTLSNIINNILKEKGIEPVLVAGHSLGEYSALACAQVFSFADGLKLVRKRGILMNKALPANHGSMAAIIGLDTDKINSICAETNGICEVANYNCPGQIVISGEKASVKEAMSQAENQGAKKVVELDVSGPFHSSLMNEAQEQFATVINALDFKKPQIPVIANTTANYVQSVTEIKEALIKQISNSVLWQDSMELMIKDGVECMIEVGPGRVLKGLMRRIDRTITAYNVEDIKSLNKVLNKLS